MQLHLLQPLYDAMLATCIQPDTPGPHKVGKHLRYISSNELPSNCKCGIAVACLLFKDPSLVEIELLLDRGSHLYDQAKLDLSALPEEIQNEQVCQGLTGTVDLFKLSGMTINHLLQNPSTDINPSDVILAYKWLFGGAAPKITYAAQSA